MQRAGEERGGGGGAPRLSGRVRARARCRGTACARPPARRLDHAPAIFSLSASRSRFIVTKSFLYVSCSLRSESMSAFACTLRSRALLSFMPCVAISFESLPSSRSMMRRVPSTAIVAPSRCAGAFFVASGSVMKSALYSPSFWRRSKTFASAAAIFCSSSCLSFLSLAICPRRRNLADSRFFVISARGVEEEEEVRGRSTPSAAVPVAGDATEVRDAAMARADARDRTPFLRHERRNLARAARAGTKSGRTIVHLTFVFARRRHLARQTAALASSDFSKAQRIKKLPT
jgi:hypothetical protein